MQWQWHANPQEWWAFTNREKGCLYLYSVPLPDNYRNLWDIPNLLLQKMPAPDFTATMKITFVPNPQIKGERTGLVVMGQDYAYCPWKIHPKDLFCRKSNVLKADNGTPEQVNDSVKLNDVTVYLRITMKQGTL